MTISENDLRELQKDMAIAARELLGPGYVTSYYYDCAADFIAIAESFAQQQISLSAVSTEGPTK